MPICVDYFRDADMFSTLDANLDYWKVEIDECNRGKTAFTSHYDRNQFSRKRFEQNNALTTSQQAIDVILYL